MTTISISEFAGQAPRVAVRQLKQNMAEHAVNCKLWSTLEPFRNSVTVKAAYNTPSTLNTIYPFGQSMIGQELLQAVPFIGSAMGGSAMGAAPEIEATTTILGVDTLLWADWPFDVDVARGAIAGDVTERTYYTGDGVPKMTTIQMAAPAYTGGPVPRTYFLLGVPAPTGTLVAVAGSGGSGVAQDTTYVRTYVSSFGEESAPSPASTIIPVLPGQEVGLSWSAESGLQDNITEQRIYRTNTGTNGIAELQYVTKIGIAETSFNDTVLSADLGEILPTEGWLPPPPNMKGLIALPNGVMAGFFDNTVCLSEPWKPYAWPIRYRQSTEFPIVGLGVIGNSVVIATIGIPYLLVGLDPGAMGMSRIPAQQPCTSKRSIVNLGYGVAYSSPDGLFVIGADGSVKNAIDPYLTRDEWQQLNPTTIHGYVLDGRYFGFYKTTTAIPWLPTAISLQGGFIYDPSSAEDGLVFIDTYATAGYADLITDALYLLVGSDIVKWDAHATTFTTMVWRSKLFVLDKPQNLGYGQCLSSAYPVTMRVYADGSLKHTETVANGNVFKLPAGFKARNWQFEIEAGCEIYSALISSSLEEIKRV